MNKDMQWLVPDRVIYWKLSGNITMDDFREGLVDISQILQSASAKIHVVFNARDARSLQGESKTVRNIARFVARDTQMGCFFVITNSFVLKHHLNRVTVDFGTQLRYSDNFRNAWNSLHNIDSSLPYAVPEKPEFAKSIRKFA